MVAPGIFCPVLYFPLWLSTYKGRGRRSKLSTAEKKNRVRQPSGNQAGVWQVCWVTDWKDAY